MFDKWYDLVERQIDRAMDVIEDVLFYAAIILVTICLVVNLAGCGKKEEAWITAPFELECTSEQMEKVEKETVFCSANTEHTPIYCYGAAIARNCTKRPNEKR